MSNESRNCSRARRNRDFTVGPPLFAMGWGKREKFARVNRSFIQMISDDAIPAMTWKTLCDSGSVSSRSDQP
jgi:hypothetical protein